MQLLSTKRKSEKVGMQEKRQEEKQKKKPHSAVSGAQHSSASLPIGREGTIARGVTRSARHGQKPCQTSDDCDFCPSNNDV